MRRGIPIVLLVVAACAVPEEAPPRNAAGATSPAALGSGTESTKDGPATVGSFVWPVDNSPTVSVDWDSVPVEQAVAELSDKSGLSFLTSPQLRGLVTLRLEGMPSVSAFRLLSKLVCCESAAIDSEAFVLEPFTCAFTLEGEFPLRDAVMITAAYTGLDAQIDDDVPRDPTKFNLDVDTPSHALRLIVQENGLTLVEKGDRVRVSSDPGATLDEPVSDPVLEARVALDLREARLQDLAAELSRQTGRRFVAAGGQEERFTIRVRRATVRSLVAYVRRASGGSLTLE